MPGYFFKQAAVLHGTGNVLYVFRYSTTVYESKIKSKYAKQRQGIIKMSVRRLFMPSTEDKSDKISLPICATAILTTS